MTTIAGNATPGLADAVVAAGAPDTIQVDLRPAAVAPAHHPGPAPGTAAIRYEQFRTVDPEAARRFFAGAYAPGWRVSGSASQLVVTHRRCAAPSLALDEVVIQGRLTVEIPPAESVLVIQPRAGSLTLTGGPFPNVEGPVLVANGMSCALRVNGARFDVVTIAAAALRKVAADWQAPVAHQIRFVNSRPRSRSALRAWQRALDYVSATLAAPDSAGQPLVVAALAPLLAGALLECYPSNGTAQELTGDPAIPETLKDAVAFIHRHVAGDVSINDIAAAVHLTPRAVQYLFRRQLDTTPTEYLRRTRLHRAHQDLVTAEPSNRTVTEIAQRWGFAHTGRFAVLYRQVYGQSPHTTLKQLT
ncbi:AraC family transcriptional regulator [Mycobacterium alsense]|uniref:AraC family transcriptional regulator n=1 Tax=Mycobacterium alsense TaxID=324058 RepID=A0AA42BYX9_9MYCO|nr:helix-turn-helix transcriptional regulator [Mycobacterium alsense]MCV7379253.1 helix-turn-helix transcriptional regulator [Mycobacterium alsense]OQZ92427.1 AraC family transcriptional regulator [Mycobacterium alsense]